MSDLKGLMHIAKQHFDEARRIEAEGYRVRSLIERQLARKHKVDQVVIGSWECENSIGRCYFSESEDPFMDYCLVCGQPNERK